jgi:hypothetical protein
MSACKGLFADRFSNFFFKKKKNQKPVFDDEEGILYIYIYIYYSDLACIEHEESKHAPHLHFSYK